MKNVFFNYFYTRDGKVVSGVLITNVSDHLPAFTVYKNDQCNTKEITSGKWTRHRSKEAIAALKEDLKKQNWDGVYVHDVNIACDSFMTLLIGLYEKHCALRVLPRKMALQNHGWLKDYKMPTRRKNIYIDIFFKLRSKEAEDR